MDLKNSGALFVGTDLINQTSSNWWKQEHSGANTCQFFLSRKRGINQKLLKAELFDLHNVPRNKCKVLRRQCQGCYNSPISFSSENKQAKKIVLI